MISQPIFPSMHEWLLMTDEQQQFAAEKYNSELTAYGFEAQKELCKLFDIPQTLSPQEEK